MKIQKKQEIEFFGTKTGNANSIALGYATETKNFGEVAVGIMNKSTAAKDPNSPKGVCVDSDATLFSVGYGGSGERKNALEVKGDGSVMVSGKNGDINVADKIKQALDTDASIKLVRSAENSLQYTLMVNDEPRGSIDIPKDQFLKNVTYDSEGKQLVFTFVTLDEDEHVEKVPVGDLKDIYKAGDGITIDGDNVISADFSSVMTAISDEKTQRETTDDEIKSTLDTKADKTELDGKFDKADVVHELGGAKNKVISQYGASKHLLCINHNIINNDGSITFADIHSVNMSNLIDIRHDDNFVIQNVFGSSSLAISYIILSRSFKFLGCKSVDVVGDNHSFTVNPTQIKAEFSEAAYIVVNSNDHSTVVTLDDNNLWRDTGISYITAYQLAQTDENIGKNQHEDKIDILGDSWTQLETSSHAGWQYTWANILINEGYDINCVARSGAGFIKYSDTYPSLFDDQIPRLRSNADVIVVFAGVNDYGYGRFTMGSANEAFLIDYNTLDTEDPETTTICNAAYKTLYTLRKKYQTKKIFFMATGVNQSNDESYSGKQSEFVENIQKICERLGIQYVDCFNNALPSYDLDDKDTWWWHQGPHPSNEGQKLLASIWKSILNL